jgi:chromosome segregation ATPase
MARLGEVRDGKEKKKLLAENKTLRDLAAAEVRRRSSAEDTLRQIEGDYRTLRSQYEERGELLAVSARNLAACDDNRAVLRQDVDRRTTAAGSLATTVLALEKELADLEAVCRQPARLKEELERAKGQVRENQSAVEALQRQLSLVENELNTMRGQSWE